MQQHLFNGIENYVKRADTRFHMPGHKGNAILPILEQIMPYDVTELPETDSLFEADGILAKSQQEAAQAVGAKALYYSAGGCTLCIQAMIRLACKNSKKIIMSRQIHRAAVITLALLDIQPIWVMPDDSAGKGFAGRITPEAVELALSANPDAGAVYITSPDYYGVIADIAGMSSVCKKYGVPLIVDNAHGAHFSFMQERRLHPIANGADMSADSAHKSLPVLTGGAYLCVNNDSFANGVSEAMMLFGSTSPSYPIMLSIESGIAWATENAQRFEQTAQRVHELGILCDSLGFVQPKGLIDPLKLVIDTATLGMTGFDAADYFRTYGIQSEMSDSRHVVFMASPLNDESDFVRLKDALKRFPITKPLEHDNYKVVLPKKAMSVREATLAENELLPVEQCLGRIAAQPSCPCPPGIPVVMPGEIIDENVCESLIRYGILSVLVVK